MKEITIPETCKWIINPERTYYKLNCGPLEIEIQQEINPNMYTVVMWYNNIRIYKIKRTYIENIENIVLEDLYTEIIEKIAMYKRIQILFLNNIKMEL